MSTITTIGVVGAGQMGSGIAQVAAQAGHHVILRDLDEKYVERAILGIRDSLSRFVAKERMSQEEADAIVERITPTTDLETFSEADFVVEAIIEDAEVKATLFRDLDRICRDGVILASNTSSIPITQLGAATERPTHVIGMHFMNPVPLMKLVEVIRGHDTTDAVVQTVLDLAAAMGKTAVEVNDFPGFVSNRVLLPMLNEAIDARWQGVGSTEAIDTVMKLGMNHPMGPLLLADFIGLDTCQAILEVLHDGLGEPKYRPSPLLKQKVMAGHLGRKTGRGFYVWENGKAVRPADQDA